VNTEKHEAWLSTEGVTAGSSALKWGPVLFTRYGNVHLCTKGIVCLVF